MNNRPEALARFRKKMESFAPLTDEDFQHISDVMHERHLNKGEVLLKEGQVCKEYYYVFRGCIRCFGLEDGRDVNVRFFFEDETACDFTSFYASEPSQFFLVAMEDSLVYYATKTEANPVFLNDTSLHMLVIRFFQDLFLKTQEHSNTFKLLSPEDRYHYLLEHDPKYLQRIPMTYLASYLGMSRETLTRVRKKTS